MKKALLIRLFVCACMALGFSYSAAAQQIYVKVHPVVPVVVRPAPPSPRHVWVAEEWKPNGRGGYVYAGGYWAAPPYGGARWIPGHWRRGRGGDYWVTGHWRR